MLQAHNDKALWHGKLIINCCFVLLGISEIVRMSDYRSVPTLSWILTEFRTDVDKVSRVDAWVLALFSLEKSALWIRIRLIHKLVLFDICVFHLMSNSVRLRGDDLQNISFADMCESDSEDLLNNPVWSLFHRLFMCFSLYISLSLHFWYYILFVDICCVASLRPWLAYNGNPGLINRPLVANKVRETTIPLIVL